MCTEVARRRVDEHKCRAYLGSHVYYALRKYRNDTFIHNNAIMYNYLYIMMNIMFK